MVLDMLDILVVGHEVKVDHCGYFRDWHPSIGILDISLLERPACGQGLGRELLHGGSIDSGSSDVILVGGLPVTRAVVNNMKPSEYICNRSDLRNGSSSMTIVQVGDFRLVDKSGCTETL